MESPWGGALTFSIGGMAHEPPRPHFEADYWSPLAFVATAQLSFEQQIGYFDNCYSWSISPG